MKVLQRAQLYYVFFQSFLYPSFELQKGFTMVGKCLSPIFFPGRTRKVFEWIFIFSLRLSPTAWVRVADSGAQGEVYATSLC